MPVRPETHKPSRSITPKHVSASQVRLKTAERGYGGRWQRTRAGYLRRHPLCVECEKAGRVTVATDLDHIIPHKGDMVAFWDSSNWQGLCKPCHSRKTATEDGGFGNRGGGDERKT
jgi:5-methylcytosine-specific restriction protein A